MRCSATAENGFELAEHDLQFRGSGEIYGGTQSGLSDLGMEAIKNLKLVEAVRTSVLSCIWNKKGRAYVGMRGP